MKGVGWYGIDSTPSWYRMNSDFFNFLVSTFPSIDLLNLFVSLPWSDTKIGWLDQFIEWCRPHGIRILVVNDANTLDETTLTDYWSAVASKYKADPVIAAFDLINEPWAFAEGDETIVELYERVIDAIRAEDPTRTCFVQGMYKHPVGLGWVRTHPVNRGNIVYVSHLYSNNANTGEYYGATDCPWNAYYQARDYPQAREVLTSGLYDRFGFVKTELGLPVAIPEVAFLPTEEGVTYGDDVLTLFNSWGIDWSYWQWYSNLDRPMNITTPDGTLRGDIYRVVQNNMVVPSLPFHDDFADLSKWKTIKGDWTIR